MKISDQDSWTGILESPPGAEVTIDGRRYLYFAGTAYFALQGHPAVIEAGCEGLRRFGVHTATSRGGYGANPALLEVEHLAAKFFGAEAAYYYISGFWGNQLTLAALRAHFDIIFYDEQSHYSILEAVQLAECPAYAFTHRSADALAEALATRMSAGQKPLVVSDGVFASSGRIAPVDDYRRVLWNIPDSILAVDDAHAVGVLGDGRGTFTHFGIPFSQVNQDPSECSAGLGPRLYACGTLSKAIGGSGGIIAGSANWIHQVKSSSRYFNAASSPAAPVAAATAAALRLVMADPEIRRRMVENTRMIRGSFSRLGLPVENTPVPFFSVTIKDGSYMRWLQKSLRERGQIIAYAQSYSGVGPEGQLRIAVSSAHSESTILKLIQEVSSLL